MSSIVPVPASEITLPWLPKLVERPRLIERLKRNKDKRLILILGQAAQGKSVLAASFVKASAIPSAWVNLHEDDSDPVNFFFSIVCALQNAVKDADLSPLLSYPAMSMGPRSEIPLYREWVTALSDSVINPVQLILDGMDRLVADAPSLSFFKVLAEEVPRHIHLIVLSRDEPPIELQKLRMRQEIAVFGNEDLAFTLEEVQEFFQEIQGVHLTSTSLKRIQGLTEGWIGGLILLGETLQRMPKDLREKYVRSDMPDQFKAEVFRYFGEAIFASQSVSVQEFLVRSSILDPVEPGFMKDLIGIKNAEELLQDLARRNLFVLPVYEEGRGWLFRYHQLFRDFLKGRLQGTVSENDRQALTLKAASLCEERGELQQSVRYYLEARAHSLAALVIERIGLELIKQGRTSELGDWLEAVPQDLIQRSPWLLFYLSMTKRFTRTVESLQSLDNAFSLFSEQGDIAGQLLSLAFLIEASVIRGHDNMPLSSLLDKAEQILGRTIPDTYPFEKAMLWNQMGFGLTVRGGNPRKGLWACEKAYLISRELGDFQLRVHALVNAVRALSWLGEFASADEKCQELEKLVEKHASPGIKLLYLTALCEAQLFRGDVEQAKKLLQHSKSEAEKHGLVYLYPVTLIYELILNPHLERYREVEVIGNRLLNFASSIGNSFMTGLALLYLGRSHYHEGEWRKAKKLLDQSRRVLSSPETRSVYHLGIISILNALVSNHLGEGETLLEELLEAQDYFTALQSFLAADAHFAAALIKQRQSATGDAVAHLSAGLRLAQEKEYTFFTMIRPMDLLRICILALELEVEDAIEYAAHLLSTRLGSLARPELKRLALDPNLRSRQKAWEIGLAIHRSNLPRLRIAALGEFEVMRGTSIILEKEWQGSQPKNVLKAILSHGAQGVRKEVLIDELWPESKPDSAEQTFKAALHRLRKSLEPDLDKSHGSSYIHLKENRIYLDCDLCKVDVYEFLSLLEEGQAKETQKDLKCALSCYNKAVDLYKGDFLPDDLYAEWAESRRRELKEKYVTALMKAGNICENWGTLGKAAAFYRRAVQADPLLEAAYQQLMLIHSNQGKRNEALKTYEQCRSALRQGLDADPDELTQSLYKRILG
jgi:LuxR family transcriptional regulator, maltose regulon positive regulatory protein